MKKNLFYVILFLSTGCLPLGLFAQFNSESVAPGEPPSGLVPGYIILSNGDTLKGKLKWSLKYVENNPVEIKFTAENGNTKIFMAGEIKGFGNKLKIWMDNDPKPIFTDMEHYLTMPSMKKGVPVFMDRLLDGRIRENPSLAQFKNFMLLAEVYNMLCIK